ncbi:hypothetical protein CPB83DRAFT_688443 [Crepidotus variabilis]|uniref:Uncharacterized protein n=1 Tax=Crepidotus variabilis TaxID=179855 RepID=A0A9P6JJP6_9AGAR|nr:hypothetical protein CPB83DRAFT_688443 [Crepidotus variabilis]
MYSSKTNFSSLSLLSACLHQIDSDSDVLVIDLPILSISFSLLPSHAHRHRSFFTLVIIYIITPQPSTVLASLLAMRYGANDNCLAAALNRLFTSW